MLSPARPPLTQHLKKFPGQGLVRSGRDPSLPRIPGSRMTRESQMHPEGPRKPRETQQDTFPFALSP